MIPYHKEAYGVGALLYSPALNSKVAEDIINGKFGPKYSIALCLEDTVSESAVTKAEKIVCDTIKELHTALSEKSFYMPKLFIRVRTPEQIKQLMSVIQNYSDVVTGFVFPKYSVDNAEQYNRHLLDVIETVGKPLYMMPIIESDDVVAYETRAGSLKYIKDKIDSMRQYTLNVRVGGNDFSRAFAVRRGISETIYDVLPVANLLCDILTVFAREYVVSGPVWEYYSGDHDEWSDGLRKELSLDKASGFIGKTVIHPNQIPIVNQALMVSKTDYADALSIANWSEGAELLVGGNADNGRMNERNTHLAWAEKTLLLAEYYGVQN